MSLILQAAARLVSPRLLWPAAAAQVGLTGTRATGCRQTPLGWELDLRLQPPTTATAVEAHVEVLAIAFGVRAVRVIRDDERADRVRLRLELRPGLGRVAYPADDRPCWFPRAAGADVLLGVDDDQRPVRLSLHGSSLLIGGSPAAGKSTAIRAVLAGLAQQRDVALVGIDPKQVELTPWAPRLTHLVRGNEPGPTLELLRALLIEVQHRAEVLADQGALFLVPDAEMPVVTLIVDEWAELAAAGTAKERSEAAELLRRYLSLGRAVGCSAVLATQRPTSDTVDTGTRALVAHRLALRCGDRWQSEAILGQGRVEAAGISLTTPGRGLLSDGSTVRPVQVLELTSDRIGEFVTPAMRAVLPW